MITIQQDKLKQNIKQVTTASVEDYANAIRSVANIIGTVIAFILAVVATAKAAYNNPVAAFKEWTKPPTPKQSAVAAPAPVKEKPKTRPASKPRPAAVKVISEQLDTSTTPKRAPRTRKKKALTTA